MSKKYIITIKSEYEDSFKGLMILGAKDSNLFVDTLAVENLEELNSDYINEHFSDLQDDAYNKGYAQCQDDYSDALKHAKDTAYQRGLNDAWEAARKLFSSMADSDIEKAFPVEWNNGGFNALINLQPQEAIAKLKAYEEKQKADDEIKVGDEVIYNGTTKCIVVRPEDDERYASLIDGDGTLYSADHRECKKTGRHFDIDKILAEMRT